MCSFSAANNETLPKTSLNNFRYRLLLSILPLPSSSILPRRYSTKTVANIGEVVGLERKEFPTTCRAKFVAILSTIYSIVVENISRNDWASITLNWNWEINTMNTKIQYIYIIYLNRYNIQCHKNALKLLFLP